MFTTPRLWQFAIDRGGTFTDIVARSPDGRLITHKLLSENPGRYSDAALQGIRDILSLPDDEGGANDDDNDDAPLPTERISAIKMGTTVGTNALLERKGARTVLLITKGFGDALRIGYQNRPDIFALDIVLPELLYERVIEVAERYSAEGEELIPIDARQVRKEMESAFASGIRSIAIVFMHAYHYPDHELEVAEIAREIGFTQVSASHQVSPLMRIVSRGETTVMDAYITPFLRRYVDGMNKELDRGGVATTKLMFMQSNGGLIDSRLFKGKESILSGPAGGIVGAVTASTMAGYEKIISFDMGGTSTDVAHYSGEYEMSSETEVAGVRIRSPMIAIHTVAAGGGSVLHFDSGRFRVGPDSAGSAPGPACYRRGGPLTVTDCNLILGRLQPDHFPNVFGPGSDLPPDAEIVREKFSGLADQINSETDAAQTPVQVAEGFLNVAVDNMANAIKKISVERGYDINDYTLCCFGGAGGQHACRVADSLGIARIFIHPNAGVLSAYGISLADMRIVLEHAVEAVLDDPLIDRIKSILSKLDRKGRCEMRNQGVADKDIVVLRKVHLRYEGTDTPIVVDFSDRDTIAASFDSAHRKRFGFVMDRASVVEAVSVEVIGVTERVEDPVIGVGGRSECKPISTVSIYTYDSFHKAQVFRREDLVPGIRIPGPSIVTDATTTIVIEPGWQVELTPHNHLILTRESPLPAHREIGTAVDPVMLEIFNNRFMSIAEQMGYTLRNTAYSVNIKERLDFSCAIFDDQGYLVANAPHIPVHLGSMGDAVQSLIRTRDVRPGEVYMLNSPYHGGTHLPDITVVTPVFGEGEVIFYLASRGHHADIGGMTPGSMPPNSRTIADEGVLCSGMTLVARGRFFEEKLRRWLLSGAFSARNPDQNIADLRAQIAANEKGVRELEKLVKRYSLMTVLAYMDHIKDHSEEAVRRALVLLTDGSFSYALDCGSVIQVQVTINHEKRSACIDFTGTTMELPTNFNAPAAVSVAAVLYVVRTLVKDAIPLNAGCLRPLEIIIPDGSMLNPRYPAAVAAGNVETSQYIVDALFGALGVLAGSQGTMNNLTLGNDDWQYYETICGGAGAGDSFDGADAVHTHMTNSRITDPEVLELRFPVLLERFSIRRGSGGAGRHCGGCGVVRRIRFLEPATAAILSSHRVLAPFGLCGGEDGKCGRNTVVRCDGTIVELGGQDVIEVAAGDVLVIETPGGGGYGDI